MKISYNWLKNYVDTNLSPEDLGKILTDTGLEVESIQKIEGLKGGLQGVIVAEVIDCFPHENADKLKVTKVNTGTETLQVVCGAPNVATGQKVLLATVGSTIYPSPEDALKIKVSTIRGVESHGMLCAEDELGLGKSHDGILVLPENIQIGTSAASYFQLEDDYEIEIGLTPNRADAMGHIGVARDLIAYLNFHEGKNLKLKLPKVDDFKVENNELPVNISILNKEACTRYCGVSIANVNVAPSPAWLQKRLRAVGLSPINNIVDATNFVMRELGTPLHAFDLGRMEHAIVVKNAEPNTSFTTLDGTERKLNKEDLMITDGQNNLCLAGIFGGTQAGIVSTTKYIFLESAVFDAVTIRKSAKRHTLNTDASFRYERGVDPDLTLYALKRAALLIQEIAGGKIAMDVVDINSLNPEEKRIEFSIEKCAKIIGVEISKEDIKTILINLDFNIIEETDLILRLSTPKYRVDVTREIDVIEEILRIYGFNKVPIPSKLNASITLSTKPNLEKIQSTLTNVLVGKGFYEILNNSLTSSNHTEKLGKDILSSTYNVEMLNPLSLELNVMRQTLIFPLLQVIEYNQNRQNADLKLFEFGKVYSKNDSGYQENKRLILAITGSKNQENWSNSKESTTYFTLKGVVDSMLEKLGLKELMKGQTLVDSILEEGNSLFVLKNKIGNIGKITSEQKKCFGIKKDVYIADLDWDLLCDSLKFAKTKYSEIPKTFSVRRDFSLLLDENVSFESIQKLALQQDKKILKEVGLFDVYEGKNLEKGKKSYAISFTFQDEQNTLKDDQVDGVMEKIRKELSTQLNAELRN